MLTPPFSIRRAQWVVRPSRTFGRMHPFSRGRVREIALMALRAFNALMIHSALSALMALMALRILMALMAPSAREV